MKTAYLHIGTMKTGTSAIQAFMSQNREVLAQKGCCYPKMELGLRSAYIYRNGQFLVWDSKREFGSESPEKEKELREKGYGILARQAEKFDSIVLSEETIWNRSRRFPNFWENLVNDFHKIGFDLKIIVYLRRQDNLVESLWNQQIKMDSRSTKEFTEYLQGNGYRFCPMNYYEKLKEIEKHVGKENMIVRVYEKGQFEGEGHSIYSDFLKSIGLELTDEYTIKEGVNLSLSGNYIEIKRIINSVPEYRELPDFMARPVLYASNQQVLEGKIPRTTMFPENEREAFLEKYRESNRKVAEDYLGRENGVLFNDPLNTLPQWSLDETTMSRDIIRAMTEVYCAQEKKINDLKKDMELTLAAYDKNLFVRGDRKIRKILKRK